jgi:tetratricopeptide (TPR) repeat protein
MYEKAIRLASIGVSPKDKSTIESAPLLDYTVKESQLPQLIAVSKEGDSLVNIIKIAYIRLGDLYKQDKGLDKAINAYRQAIKYSEKESSAYLQFKIGECYEEKNDFNAAIQEYLNIPRLCEKDTFWVVKGLLCSANIYEQSEDWPKAMSMYERVLNYDTQEAKYAKERIGFIKSVQ